MQIFELDYDDRREKLEEQIRHLDNINLIISERRSDIRSFAINKDINFSSIDRCFNFFERTVLIELYTLTEQLAKNFYYELLEKDKHENVHVKQFINIKIKEDKFSPNVRYDMFGENIHKDLVEGFKFIISKKKDEVKLYDSMISARHQYAHSGNYTFERDSLGKVSKVVDYIHSELSMVVLKGATYRLEFQNRVIKLKEAEKLCQKKINDYRGVFNYKSTEEKNNIRMEMRENFRVIKNICSDFIKNDKDYFNNCEILSCLFKEIKKFSKLDLRSLDKTINSFDRIKNVIDTYIG